MYIVMNYSLAYENCDVLVLRRTFKELDSGAIKDFQTFVPPELYKYDQTKHVATFTNGSRVVFGHWDWIVHCLFNMRCIWATSCAVT